MLCGTFSNCRTEVTPPQRHAAAAAALQCGSRQVAALSKKLPHLFVKLPHFDLKFAALDRKVPHLIKFKLNKYPHKGEREQ